MNSARNASITESAKTILATTQVSWSCSAPPTRTKGAVALAPVATTAPAARAVHSVVCLGPNDPYPTWPFTMVEPKSLARWCRKNLSNPDTYEEAPF